MAEAVRLRHFRFGDIGKFVLAESGYARAQREGSERLKKRAQTNQNAVSSCWYTIKDFKPSFVRLADVVHSAFESSARNFLFYQRGLKFRYSGNVALYPKLFPEISSQR